MPTKRYKPKQIVIVPRQIEVEIVESNGKVAGPNGAAAKLEIPRSTLDLKIKQLNKMLMPLEVI
jgi:hypothetical protein